MIEFLEFVHQNALHYFGTMCYMALVFHALYKTVDKIVSRPLPPHFHFYGEDDEPTEV